jgi:hypothetical protein
VTFAVAVSMGSFLLWVVAMGVPFGGGLLSVSKNSELAC